VIAPHSGLNAQIRTPIAPEPILVTTPGPAPYNAKAVATSPTSVAVSWDAVGGTRAYTVDRARTDDAACCVAHSGLITSTSWTDGSLEAGKEYVFVITALYFDGRQGSTQVIAATPMPTLPAVRLPKDAELLTASETILRYTECGQKSAGPGPASITPDVGSPAGARFRWALLPGVTNYVVDRAPEGTTNWTFVGSTCGGPSPISVWTDAAYIRDLAGGVTPLLRYVYRVTAVSSNGAAGWLTYHFTAPCRYIPTPQTTVSGSTVTVKWVSGSSCSYESSIGPDTYTLSTSFGYTKTFSTFSPTQDVIYGVPVGTHTITVVGNYRTGGTTRPGTATITVAY
jgi:hypothetical protein